MYITKVVLQKPLKVDIFGLVDESISHCNYFTLDETESIGENGSQTHEANSILPMLDFYLKKEDHGEASLIMYCDNCAGQNKNRFLMAYCAHLIKTKRYKTVEVHFLPVGHTKFSPDAFFGHFKKVLYSSRSFNILVPSVTV